MTLYVNAMARSGGTGTKESPFRTISEAAKIAEAGDEVLVAPGIYRECIDPVNGGTDDKHRIIYRSEEPLAAIITGAEAVKNWIKYQDTVWSARIPNGIFGAYNPYTALLKGDWYLSTEPFHTGEVFLNGKALYEAQRLEDVLDSVVNQESWEPDFTIYKWYAHQDGGDTVIFANFHGVDPNLENVEITVRRNCFFPSRTGVNYITLSGFTVRQAATQWAPPTAFQDGMIGPHWSKGWIIEDCEISDSRCSGISLGKYLQPNNENKWTTMRMKDGTQTEREVVCQAQREGWTKERIGSHTIRRCNIHHCGQTGIVGHLGCVFSVIEDNHIHHINSKQELKGAEIAGIKLHAAIDTTLRRNHIHHCTRGIWLDWQAQGTRVTQSLFHDNEPPVGTKFTPLSIGEDIFVEVSHGPTLIDNNVMLSSSSARLSTQGVAMVHNLIAGAFAGVGIGTDNAGCKSPAPRYTPYHVPHRTEIAGFMTFLHGDMRFYNNIFIQQPIREDFLAYAKVLLDEEFIAEMPSFVAGTKPYDGYPTTDAYFSNLTNPDEFGVYSRDKYYDHLPVSTGGNVFLNGAQPCDSEENFAVDETPVFLKLEECDGCYKLNTNLYQILPKLATPFVSTELLGEAFEPEQKFEAPDGTPIFFDRDYFGERHGINPTPGPFVSGCELEHSLAEFR